MASGKIGAGHAPTRVKRRPPFEGGAGRAPCLSRKGAGPVDGAMKPVEKAVTALPFRLCSSVTLAGPSWEKVAPMPPASRNPIFPAKLGLRVGAGLGAPPLGGESPPPRPPQPSPHSASAEIAHRNRCAGVRLNQKWGVKAVSGGDAASS